MERRILSQFTILLSLLNSFAQAAFNVRSRDGRTTSTFESSTFEYFGVDQRSPIFDANLTFMTSSDICGHPTRSMMEDAVVVSILVNPECSYTQMYDVLENARVKAWVLCTRNVPGVYSYFHETWDRREFQHRSMKMLAISFFDVGQATLSQWATSASGDFIIDILLPHDLSFQDAFESSWWSLVIRALIPIFAFYTSAMAFQEAYKRRRRTRSVSFALFLVNVPANFSISLALILGTFGPTLLPLNVHMGFSLLLTGCSLFTATLLIMIIREKNRHHILQLPKRDVWASYRHAIFGSAFLFIGFDLLLLVVHFSDSFVYFRRNLFASAHIILPIIETALAVYFIFQIRTFRAPILAYLRHPDSNPDPLKIKEIKILVMWLNMSSACMLSSAASLACIFYFSMRVKNVGIYTLAVAIFALSRIGVSYSEVGFVYT